jgi:hypothetical protein
MAKIKVNMSAITQIFIFKLNEMNPGLVTFSTQPVETGDKDHVADRSLCYLAIISHISRICYRTIILFSCTFVLLCHQLSRNKIGPW